MRRPFFNLKYHERDKRQEIIEKTVNVNQYFIYAALVPNQNCNLAFQNHSIQRIRGWCPTLTISIVKFSTIQTH